MNDHQPLARSLLPPLRELGLELLGISWIQRCAALSLPFVCVAIYFLCAFANWWPGAVLSLMALSFVTYGSTSHDLVHRSMGLPSRANEFFLCVIELLAFRSGHAYRDRTFVPSRPISGGR